MSVRINGFDRGDRTSIDLPEVQKNMLAALTATGKPVVFVLTTGSAVGLEWENENIPAIVNAWYGGQAGGTAVADVLFGDYNPSGILPVTFYRSVEDLPDFEEYGMDGRAYRYFDGKPVYAFGHGLSYTDFKYSDLNIIDKGETVDVSFVIKNTGKYDGDEVAQIYVKLPSYEGKAPVKELKGFSRVHLKKGERKLVTVSLRRDELRYWSEEKGFYIIPEGLPEVYVGTSSEDIRLEQHLSTIAFEANKK